MIRVSNALRTAIMVTGSVNSRLDGGFLFFFSGTQPSDAEDAAVGTLLAAVSIGAAGTTGLTLVAGDAAGQAKKTVAESWQAVGLAAGTARWYRYQRLATNLAGTQAAALAAADGTTERVDGSIGVSGADLIAASVAVALNAPLTVDTYVLTLPASAG